MPDTAPANLESHLARFGLASFRPGQREVISAVLAGQDCLCIMPTGGGKSLCYQLPATMRQGLTLVVSPLIALMKDQVDALGRLGIPATFINSSQPPSEQHARLERMSAGEYRLVYIAPERLRSPVFLERIRATRVELLAIDEAHCISEWGHDFRPDYARLGLFRQRLGFPQTIALTATATPTVRADVLQILQLREPQTFITGFARPNLRFEVQYPRSYGEKDERLLAFLNETPGAGIVYASTRKRCHELVEILSGLPGRRAAFYHAGLLPEERRKVQDEFMSGQKPIIVATNAFGMGIDKPDLRFVVHYNLPGSLEAYYQEAGRAGRDGLPSRCLLLYSPKDRNVQEFFIENNYPAPETVEAVYDYLRSLKDDPIEITQQELKDRLSLDVGAEGIGSCEQLLERYGALERLNPRQNMAAVRIDSDLPTLVDLLPRQANVRRRVLRGVEQIVGELRYERIYFQPALLASQLELEPDSVRTALRELSNLKGFDYVPPFRGRAIHMLEGERPFAALKIDFEELDRRKSAEYAKLDRMIGFAQTRRCRQLDILDYFGDPSKRTCGNCDNCPTDARTPRITGSAGGDDAASEAPVQAIVEAIKIALSGVARTKGKVGKVLVAKMLCGSRSQQVVKLRLDQLSTFGLLNRLKQDEAVELIDALTSLGMIEAIETQKFRPVVQLTQLGTNVMRGVTPPPERLPIRKPLWRKLQAGRADEEDFTATTQSAPIAPREVREPASIAPLHSQNSSLPAPVERPTPEAYCETPASHPSYYWTWRLLAAGFAPHECAEIRRLSLEMVLDHAHRAMDEGRPVEPRWFFTDGELQQLGELTRGVAPSQIRPLLSQLPPHIGYSQVLLYLKCQGR